jgi:nucleoid DNA-binding protein
MIAHSISQKTLANVVDVETIILAVMQEIPERLLQGETVELPPLGNFRLTIQNNGGSETREEWDIKLIKGGHLVYSAPKALREAMRKAPLVRWINHEAEAIMDHAYATKKKVRKAQTELSSLEQLVAHFEADAAAHPDDKHKAITASGTKAQLALYRDLLDMAREEAAAATAAAKRVEEDLNHQLSEE